VSESSDTVNFIEKLQLIGWLQMWLWFVSHEELITGEILVLQIEVVRTFGDNEGPPWKHSLFGNPNDADTSR